MRTREQNRIYGKLYRQRHPEKFKIYEKKRNKIKGEIRRQERMGDKKCRICEIRLAGNFGGFGTKYYCRSCVDSGEAQKHSVREAMRRFRLKRKLLVNI